MGRGNEQLRYLLEGVSDLFGIIDLDGKLIYSNQAWREVLGSCEAEQSGICFFDLVHCESRPGFLEAFQGVQASSGIHQLEVTLMAPDGNQILVEGRLTYQLAAGEKPEIWSLWRQVTDRNDPRVNQVESNRSNTENKDLQQPSQQMMWSQRFLHNILNTIADPMFVKDSQHRLVIVNNALCRLLRYSREELIGKSDYELFPKEEADVFCAKDELVFSTGRENENEEYLTDAQGNRHIISTKKSLFSDGGGNKILVGVIRDLTLRHQAEEALRKSEARYRLLAENSTDMISRHSPDMEFLYVSPACKNLLGYDPSELMGRSAYEFFHPKDLAGLKKHYATISEAAKSSSLTYRMRCLDGSYIWFETTSKVVEHPETGAVLEIVAVSRDVTSRKQVEAALLSSEERFRLVFSDAAIGIALYDRSGRFIEVNPAFSEILGYTESQLRQLTVKDITHPEDMEKEIPLMEQGRSGEISSYRIEKRYIKSDGEIAWVNLTVSMLRDTEGKLLYRLGTIEEIGERKRAEAEILKALGREKELSEMKSRFVSIVSHEFRTPLTTIQSAADILEEFPCTETEKLELFGQIKDAITQMIRLLEDVLFIGRAEALKIPFNQTWFDLVAFCRALVMELEISTGKTHSVVFSYQGDYWVRLDEKLLRQILSNLISNAIKYSPPGSRINLELMRRSGEINFQIKDSGLGIAPEDKPHLFEFFHRGCNVGTIPGTGLGLAIVKKCVDMHGGAIAVESQVGKGTTFSVTLPLSQEESDSENNTGN
ncbi:MAG: PAS domain S-box protein [Hormoscilla sp.]